MKLITTSVVRGANQGESHGGVYLIDTDKQQVEQVIDWNTSNIDWQGRGWDRGLRGIAIHNQLVYIAASDELFAYDTQFNLVGSWRNPYLKHCHEICIFQDKLYITSTAYDSIIAFDPATSTFDWALQIESNGLDFFPIKFDPRGEDGPLPLNKFHINNIHIDENGMYFSGLKSGGLLKYDGKQISMVATLPVGTHNARPFGNGILFNDTQADAVRYVSRQPDESCTIKVPEFAIAELSGVAQAGGSARANFGRGMCVLKDHIIAAGSSPSTIAIHDLRNGNTPVVINLSDDIRNAIHGLEVWPF